MSECCCLAVYLLFRIGDNNGLQIADEAAAKAHPHN
jgi:hypothetical protein